MSRLFGAICAIAAAIAIIGTLWAHFHEDQLEVLIQASRSPLPIIKVVNQRTLDPVAGARVAILHQPGGFGSNLTVPLGWWDTDSNGVVNPAPPIPDLVQANPNWTPSTGPAGEPVFCFFIDAWKPRFKPGRAPGSYWISQPNAPSQPSPVPTFRIEDVRINRIQPYLPGG